MIRELHAREEELEGSSYFVCRIEQLYPFPDEEIKELLREHPVKSAYWVQEEPRNMGAWSFINGLFQEELDTPLGYIGRKSSASTATGSAKHHSVEQGEITQTVVEVILD